MLKWIKGYEGAYAGSDTGEAQEAMGMQDGHAIYACLSNPNRCKTAYAFIWSYLNEESRPDESIKPTKV